MNTCTVTEEADREARQLIRRIASRNPQARVIVTGCYAQRAPEELAVCLASVMSSEIRTNRCWASLP